MDAAKVEKVQHKHEEILKEKLNSSFAELGLEKMYQAAAEEKREKHMEEVTTRAKKHDRHVAELHTRHSKSLEEMEAEDSAHLKVKLYKEDLRLSVQHQDRINQLVYEKQKLSEKLARVELHHKELEEQTRAATAACQTKLDKSLTHADEMRNQHRLKMVDKLKEHDLHVNEVRQRHGALSAEHEMELKRDQEVHETRRKEGVEKVRENADKITMEKGWMDERLEEGSKAMKQTEKLEITR